MKNYDNTVKRWHNVSKAKIKPTTNLLCFATEGVQKCDSGSLDLFVASSQKFFHDATDAGLGRVVRNGKDDSLAVIQDVGLTRTASGFSQGVNESRKNFGLKEKNREHFKQFSSV